jgi:NAD(P)-dependent dehydrogenase (short-subunit alcohol dehydrogenase family)
VKTQKVVLVTGASSGIGEAIAKNLAAAGWRVFGTSRNPRGRVDHVEMIAMDVDDDVSVDQGVAQVLASAGRLDAVVNNAGWALAGAVEDTAIAEAQAQFDTNVFGVLRVCRAVLPAMREQGGGHIVNISSLGGAFGMPFSGVYSASKFAVEGLSEALRFETRKLGIRVVLIEPGDMQTRLPESRRTVAAAGDDSTYHAAFERYKSQQAKDEAKAPSPQRVARVVAAVLRHPNPPLRHAVAMPSQRIVLPLKRLLPYRWFEAIVGSAMGA